MSRNISFASAIREALDTAMTIDKNVFVYGLGTDDPKGVFGTTLGLKEKHGGDRVFDMPTAENAMTGIGIGAAIGGCPSVLTHQRLDFALLSLDQIVNNAAKWQYMFGGKSSVPITIRMILGRGWGQGPTHSQSLQSWFAHIPGLKVVMPTTPADAKGLLLESIFDPDPVIFLEHRWLHESIGHVPEGDFRLPLGKAQKISEGKDVTVVSMSYMTIEAIHALSFLEKKGISVDLIDLRSINPIDWPMIAQSVKKTGRLLVLDTSHETCSVAGEIIAKMSCELFSSLKAAPKRLCLPDHPVPTSPALTAGLYPEAREIFQACAALMGASAGELPPKKDGPHDVPGNWFKGPF